jgi:hypothetical protein
MSLIEPGYSVQYAFLFGYSNTYQAVVSGIGIIASGTYTAGDIFSLYTNGSFVSFQQNGSVVATTALNTSFNYKARLLADVSNQNYIFTDVRFYPTGQFKNPTETLISAYSTTIQTITAPTPILHDGISISNLINPATPAPGFSGFVPTYTGIYKAMYSIQFLGITGNDTLIVWAVVNGTAVADSATYTAFKNNDTGVIVTELIVPLNAGDVFEWYAATQGGTPVDIQYYAPVPPIPAAPGIITNMYKLR